MFSPRACLITTLSVIKGMAEGGLQALQAQVETPKTPKSEPFDPPAVDEVNDSEILNEELRRFEQLRARM